MDLYYLTNDYIQVLLFLSISAMNNHTYIYRKSYLYYFTLVLYRHEIECINVNISILRL